MYTIDELGDDTLDLDELIGRQLLFLEISAGWHQSESSLSFVLFLSLSLSPLFLVSSLYLFVVFFIFWPFEKRKKIHLYIYRTTELEMF